MNFPRVYQDMGESYFLSNPLFAFPTEGHDRIKVSGYAYASKRFLFLEYGETNIINISKSYF